MMSDGRALRAQLNRNSSHFRQRMSDAGFRLSGKDHAIIPVMLGDAKLASEMAERMLQRGNLCGGFFLPGGPQRASSNSYPNVGSP